MAEQQEFWFAARTRRDQEFAVRDALKKLNVEYFLPTRKIVRELKYRRKMVEVPVIRNVIFVRATKDRACSIANDYGVQLFYMKDLSTHSMLVVPDRQMKDFMFVMDIAPDGVSVETEPFTVGEKVRVVKGDFCGIEGELMSIANKTHVMIRIPQVMAVTVRVPKRFVEKVKVV
ncbi:UpxY family transcription antiterminator [Bacteroides sp. 224]|uniref:UpxY family transcription antiterminator n=1 Tax=Bacteroides sp. 224 TaxID=2302936 RepID=UPI0013D30A5A|nr:UpxY family transcription antiterminator [Bacteroides sp. 224]NDV64974.1 UpxY family transcription antiterminator [Bacteroides sp. 224]